MENITTFINNAFTSIAAIPWHNLQLIRPLWLLAIPLVIVVAWLIHRFRHQALWNTLITAKNLQWLLQGKAGMSRFLPLLFALMWLIGLAALSGPTWEQQPQPTSNNPDGLVILFDLSPSMNAADIKPSRLIRAKLKLTDLLRARKDGQTALVAYAGDAYVVSPLTTDAKTIIGLLQALEPKIIPSQGSNVESGIELAAQLFKSAGIRYGHILVITDEIKPRAQMRIKGLLHKASSALSQHRLSVLGIGTETGAPIPTDDGNTGNFMRTRNGQVILARLNRNELEVLAATNNGRYITIKTNDSDIDYLLDSNFAQSMLARLQPSQDNTNFIQRQQYSDWIDQGGWLVLLMLPLALLLFRRGWLYSLLLFSLLSAPNHELLAQQTPNATIGNSPLSTPLSAQSIPSQPATIPATTDTVSVELSTWDKLWLNRDQQAVKILETNPLQAAEQFSSNEWKAIANYQANDFDTALEQLTDIDSAQSLINQAKVEIAKQDGGRALKALDKAISKAQATNNFSIEQQAQDYKKVEQWLIEQQEQQQQQSSSEDGEQQEGEQQEGEQQEQQEDKQSEQQQSQSSEDEASEEESASSESKDSDEEGKEESEQQAGEESDESEEGEEEQTIEQPSEEELQALQRQRWLETIKDDPAGLLRRKFQYEAEQRRNNREPPPTEERY